MVQINFSQSQNCFKSILSLSVLITIVYFCQSSNAQLPYFGFCPRINGMREFNISRYEGLWYEVEKFWFVVEATSSCVSVRYTNNKDGTFGVEISQIEGVTRTRMVNPGMTWYRSRDGTADFVLDILVTQSPVPFHFKYPYLVLDTDYENYTIKYRCTQIGLIHLQNMWILSRTKGLTPDIRNIIYNFLRKQGLDSSRLRRSNLATCPE